MINSGRATRGMAVAPHALASQSALAVLREDGNAVEAMIAAAATIPVVYPHMNSIGGDGFWLIHTPGQAARAIDACGAAAMAASRDWYMKVDPQHLLAADKIRALAAAIDRSKAAPWGKSKGPADTIWMGVIDGDGRAVSFIQSLYHEFGSGVVLRHTGINWQNRGCSFSLDPGALNALEPGRKPFHTLNPALAVLADRRTIVYGNMGGDGQPQTQSAVFTRSVVHGWGPPAAISAPRWLLGRTWGGTTETLRLESRFPREVVEELRSRGHDVEMLGEFDETVGHAGAIIRHPNGVLEGGADPRSDGGVAGF
jgi:gamma-glutamyltranspeptidase/glutathione hydrolase